MDRPRRRLSRTRGSGAEVTTSIPPRPPTPRLAAANEGRRARLRGGDAGDVVIQLTREQFNARLANGHQIELFDEGKGCRIVGRDEEAELEWFEDYWQ